MRSLALSAAILLAATGCATQNAGAPVAADQVAVHETVTSVTRPYKVIKRVWVDSWASNTFVPTYASRDDAVRADALAVAFAAVFFVALPCADAPRGLIAVVTRHPPVPSSCCGKFCEGIARTVMECSRQLA